MTCLSTRCRRARAARYGRNPRNIKFLAGASIVVGKTADEASAKIDDYKRYLSAEARLAHSQSRIDYTAFPKDVTIGQLKAREVSGYEFIPPCLSIF